MSQGVLKVNQGSLYPALQRLEEQAWIDSDAAAPVVLLAAALAAGWLPARRAARVDTAAALRCD
ncbi:MAG: hypothetical protein DMG59_17335 [Acidobacteria bacterium]|nr:MAG: hypothetical protein DMG59_17335 [Acidobacteriota bacterium]